MVIYQFCFTVNGYYIIRNVSSVVTATATGIFTLHVFDIF